MNIRLTYNLDSVDNGVYIYAGMQPVSSYIWGIKTRSGKTINLSFAPFSPIFLEF